MDIFRAPIQITVGMLYGVVFGLLLWFLPTDHFVSSIKHKFNMQGWCKATNFVSLVIVCVNPANGLVRYCTASLS